MININSNPKRKAIECREWEGRRLIGLTIDAISGDCVMIEQNVSKPAVWAFEHEGEFYCFMPDTKPECASEESRIITRRTYSSSDRWQTETARHCVCRIRGYKDKNE